MGAKKWAGANTSWTTAGNWDPVGVPGSDDDVTFDNTDVTDCTMDAAIDVKSLTVAGGGSDYSGKLDFGDSAFAHSIGVGGGAFGGSGEVDCGDSTITCGGSFDNKDQGTWDDGTSTLVMTGTGNLTGSFNMAYDVTIDPDAVITVTDSGSIVNDVIVNGTLSINSGKIFQMGKLGTVSLGAAGRITGSGTWRIIDVIAGKGFTSFAVGGVVDVAVLSIYRPTAAATPLAAGTYASALVKIESATAAGKVLTLSSGAYVFQGDVTIDADVGGSITIANNTNNPAISIGGDVTFSGVGTTTWAKGDSTGSITLDGSSAQSVNFADENIEALIIAGGDTVTFTGGWTAASFSAQAGDFDPGGQTLVTTGDFSIAAGVNLISSLADVDLWTGVDLTIGGTFAAVGMVGDLCNLRGDGGWTIDATAVGVVSKVHVDDSDASAGVDITAKYSTDAGVNAGWIFTAPSAGSMLLLGA